MKTKPTWMRQRVKLVCYYVFPGAVALAVRQDSRGANSSHVVVPSENDAENPVIHVPSYDDPGSLALPSKEEGKTNHADCILLQYIRSKTCLSH